MRRLTCCLSPAEYLDGGMLSRLNLQKDGLWLYRNMLCPAVPQLAFVGCEVRSAAHNPSCLAEDRQDP